MELQQLKYFMETAKYEHLTKAAESLYISQPALSQAIIRLEHELGVVLFDRSSRKNCPEFNRRYAIARARNRFRYS